MNFSIEALIQVLVIVVVAIVLIWIIGAFVPALGLPAIIVTLLNVIVGLAALVAILRTLGLLSR
jgi:hypothetical protein